MCIYSNGRVREEKREIGEMIMRNWDFRQLCMPVNL